MAQMSPNDLFILMVALRKAISAVNIDLNAVLVIEDTEIIDLLKLALSNSIEKVK